MTARVRPGGAATARSARPLLVTVVALLLLLAPQLPVAQAAGSLDRILAEYRKSQKIDACKFSAGQLKDARKHIPNDIDQYAPDFPAALDTAIGQRGACGAAAGGAAKSASATTTGAAAATTTPTTPPATTSEAPAAGAAGGTTTPAAGAAGAAGATTPAPAATPSADPTQTPNPGAVTQPAPAAQDGAIAAAAVTKKDSTRDRWLWAAIAGAIVLAALLGWALVAATGRVRWLAPVGHAMGEAGWRISARWAEFTDWMRFGSGR